MPYTSNESAQSTAVLKKHRLFWQSWINNYSGKNSERKQGLVRNNDSFRQRVFAPTLMASTLDTLFLQETRLCAY